MSNKVSDIFLTFFYVGLVPKMQGTVASIISFLIAIILIKYTSSTTVLLLAILITIVSIKPINDYEKKHNTKDPKEIVIDEVVGTFIAVSIAYSSFLASIISLIFFRIFDITKPSIIGKIDKNVKGGIGVMGDDIIAGFLGGLASLLCLELLKALSIPLPTLNIF